MDCRHSEVSVPLYPRWGLFTVESINGATTISLHHHPILSSIMETGRIERPDMNSNCGPAAPAPNQFPISQQQEPISDSKGGCSFCQRRELNLEELLNFERELIKRGFHLAQQYPQQISQQGVAFTETHNQVLQPKSAKRSNQILQPESSKKLKQDNSKSPDSQLTESLGWCSLCQIDCKGKRALKEHILGKKHRQTLKKLKEGEIIGNLEKNEKQVNKGDVPQKKRKRSPNTNEQTVKCNTCDKVFITQDCFESHIAGKKHAKQLKLMESFKVSSKAKDDSKKCAADGNSSARSDKFDVKAKTVLKDQRQKEKADMSSNKQKKSKNLVAFSKKKCKTCDVVLYSETDFEKHFSGRKHSRMLKISEISKSSLESKGNGKECGKVDGKESGSSDFGLPTNENADKTIEDKTILELKDDGNLRANSDKDVQRDDAEIKEIDGDNVYVPDGEDNKLEVEVRNDNDVQKEIAEIKEIDGKNVDVPNGEDNNLDVEVRDDKENTKTDNFDGKKDNKMDIKEVAISDLKQSEASDDGSLVKDDVDKISEDIIILEVKDNAGLEAHGVKDGL